MSDRHILSPWDVFTLPLGLTLMLIWTSNLESSTSESLILNLSHYVDFSTSSPTDLVILRWAYKYVREIARRMELYHGDLQVGHPTFAEGSQAATQPACSPVEISAPEIVYSKEDDDAIDEYHRRSGLLNY